MKLGQKGFSPVEVIATLVVVGVIAFVGWRVYDGNQSEDNQAPTEVDSVFLGEDEPRYESELGYSFSYPSNWVIQEDDILNESVQLFSNDTFNGEAIYACVRVAQVDQPTSIATKQPIEVIEQFSYSSSRPSLEIVQGKTLAGYDFLRLWDSNGVSGLSIADGKNLEVEVSYNCVQNDFSVIKNNPDFDFDSRPETEFAKAILRSFEAFED